MNHRIVLPLFMILFACAGAGGEVIYGVPEKAGEVVGARDINILADDVHFAAPSIVRRIDVRLAIAGEQECRLWVFGGMDSDPLWTESFTNATATNEFNVSTYSFDVELVAPKDVYVGFSAQGDGWGANGVDYWSRGTNVAIGVAGTPGQYYYGPITGGRLTTVYGTGDASFGCVQVISEPVRIEGLATVSGAVHLAVSGLPIHATNVVERCESAVAAPWVEAGVLPSGEASQVWIADAGAATAACYRVTSR